MMARNRLFSHALAAAALLTAASPAAACLPPPPGMPEPPEPTREEKVRSMVGASANIVSGKIVGYRGRDDRYRFRVEHVYKGNIRRGTVLLARQGWGMDPPMCFGMIVPPPTPTGTRGTIFFRDQAELNFIAGEDLERAFAMGLLQRAPGRRAR